GGMPKTLKSQTQLGYGIAVALAMPANIIERKKGRCIPKAYATATAAPDPRCICDLGHSVWQYHGSVVNESNAAQITTAMRDPSSSALGVGIVWSLESHRVGREESLPRRQALLQSHRTPSLHTCLQGAPLDPTAGWPGGPQPSQGHSSAHCRAGRMWTSSFQPLFLALEGRLRTAQLLGQGAGRFLPRPALLRAPVQALTLGGYQPLPHPSPPPTPEWLLTGEVNPAEGAGYLVSGGRGELWVQNTPQEREEIQEGRVASWQLREVTAVTMPPAPGLLPSPFPQKGNGLLRSHLAVSKGATMSEVLCPAPGGTVRLYHHHPGTLKFLSSQRQRPRDTHTHPEIRNASRSSLGYLGLQELRSQEEAASHSQAGHFSQARAWDHQLMVSELGVLKERGLAWEARGLGPSPEGSTTYAARAGLVLSPTALDLCSQHRRGAGVEPPPAPAQR
uniref:Uncharacterized protein n=1 Tax=Sus scrofa TaxID=9823 RepID=A0A4X1UYR0_PIG